MGTGHLYEDVDGLDKVAAVSAAHPEPAMYPRFADVQDAGLSVTLHAGDVLYIPAYWYERALPMSLGCCSNCGLALGVVELASRCTRIPIAQVP